MFTRYHQHTHRWHIPNLPVVIWKEGNWWVGMVCDHVYYACSQGLTRPECVANLQAIVTDIAKHEPNRSPFGRSTDWHIRVAKGYRSLHTGTPFTVSHERLWTGRNNPKANQC